MKNGRLVLDEPTDLPEGAEVTLSITDDDGGDYDDEERERINESLAVSFEQTRAAAHRCGRRARTASRPSMNVRFTPRAESEAERKREWWRTMT